MSERGGEGRKEPANENSRERMTLEAIEIDPWNAVDLPFPADADRTLLERAAFAADQCDKAALAAARVAQITDPDRAGAYLLRSIDASERSEEARRNLGALPPEQLSKVSPFLDPAQLQDKAMLNVLAEISASRGFDPRAAITAATIDRNPWAVLWSDLSGAGPELLGRVRDTAVGLVREAMGRRDERSSTPEEAALWNSYAEAARNTYIDAYALQELGRASEPLTRQAIARDAWNAVTLDIPENASPELLSLIAATAHDLGRTLTTRAQQAVREEEAVEFIDLSGEARQRQQDAEARLGALDAGHGWDSGEAVAEQVLPRDEFTRDDLEGNPWAIVDKHIPRDADVAMLAQARAVVATCVEAVEWEIEWESPRDNAVPGYLDARLEDANARVAELDARLELARGSGLVEGQEPVRGDRDDAYREFPSGAVERAAADLGNEPTRPETIYERYPGLTHGDSGDYERHPAEDDRDVDDRGDRGR
jgi:hypothetical protein